MNVFPIDKLKEQLDKVQSTYRFSDDLIFAAQMKALFSEKSYRRSGRSFLLLRTFIELSIEEGREVELLDHFNGIDYRESRGLLEDVLNWYIREGVHITYNWRPIGSQKMKIMFTLNHNSLEAYNKLRISNFEFKVIEAPRQFSQLLLIL